ncbi:MAG: ribulose-phosphate 3-epimerase [Ruminococcaceae bacterium]|nr:ribulose-phosphate 3-epimerase [Oscillospiraceae bacterium]
MQVAPSLLSCDFADIKNEIKTVNSADMLHLDVMDGHFVPNISIGIPVVQSIRKATDMVLDCHLMISDPEKYVPQFAKAGADIITFHVEATENCGKLIDTITELGVKPSLSIKPNTPAEAVFPYLDKLYMVLVMTVEPGFGGQKMITDCLEKVKVIKAEIARRGLDTIVQADGGINDETLAMTVESGVDVAVLGSAVFAQSDRNSYIEKIQRM